MFDLLFSQLTRKMSAYHKSVILNEKELSLRGAVVKSLALYTMGSQVRSWVSHVLCVIL